MEAGSVKTGIKGSVETVQTEQQKRERMSNETHSHVRDQSYIKQYNIQTVLAMLKQHQPISRTEVARLTGMSPTSITRIVTALINQNLIYETSGEQRSGRGRKATNLCINAEGLYSIGIHLEPSRIHLCVLNMADEILYRVETLVDGECTPEKMAAESKKLFAAMPKNIVPDQSRIGSVGVCLSGRVDPWNGLVNSSSHLKWKSVDLAALYSREFGIPACIENDVKACLISEKVRMQIPDESDTVYLLVDNGTGMAATSAGRIVRGTNNEAGEIEDIPCGTKPDGTTDYLANHLRCCRLIDRARGFDPGIHSLDALLWAQQQGLKWAVDLIAEFRDTLEKVIRMIECVYNPEKIVIGGSVTHKLYRDIAGQTSSSIVCLGVNYEESCMAGMGLIAMRKAIVECIGQNFE